ASGKTTYDFKQNIAGYISFKANAEAGDLIDLVMGELLDENKEVDLTNIQCINKGKRTPLQEVHYICKDGLNEYKGSFYFAGFRYVTIDADVELESIEAIALYSDMEETSSFHCSNELINTFYRNTLWSLKGNSIDIPTDCPTRERMGWTGDSQVFFETASFLTCYASFARKHLNDVFDRQWKDGKLPQIAPYSNEDWFMDVMNGSVGWADVGILIPYRYYRKYGDERILKDHYEEMLKYAHFMIHRCNRWGGIYAPHVKLKKYQKYFVNKGQSYGEWAEPNDVKAFVWYDFASPHPEESTAYTSYVLRIMAEICHILKKEEDAELLEEYAEGCRKAYQELITQKAYSIDTDRQAKLVRPLYMNLLSEADTQFARKRLIEALDHYGWRLGTGFLSTPFILYVLEEIDPEYAYRLLENEEMPGWLYMSKHDTGTIWEGWEGPNSQAGIASLNHYSKGAMVEWLFKRMCGIELDGKNHFTLKPVIGGKETSASCTYQSIYGKIASSWKKEGDHIIYEFTVPANTTCTFIDLKGNLEEYNAGTYRIER
ncbi:MAG: family 78 glycoside hydrolase catalytic domain, partial [Erysipelotrichaceae bacterium]|nr:family 78 glycoside hydrolase catalytic domain [Erysipelotrichaceae bacterium]